MTACEPVNGLPLQPFDERIEEVRAFYLNGISDVIDEALSKFMLPGDRLSLLKDAAPFVCFMLAIKAAECTIPAGSQIERRSALTQWWPLQKIILKDVPAMLLDFGREAERAKLEGTGETAS